MVIFRCSCSHKPEERPTEGEGGKKRTTDPFSRVVLLLDLYSVAFAGAVREERDVMEGDEARLLPRTRGLSRLHQVRPLNPRSLSAFRLPPTSPPGFLHHSSLDLQELWFCPPRSTIHPLAYPLFTPWPILCSPVLCMVPTSMPYVLVTQVLF